MLAEDFANRLRKNLKKFEKWARQEGIECYRLYDADLPEYNVAIDRYADWVVVENMPRQNRRCAQSAPAPVRYYRRDHRRTGHGA